MTPRSRRGGWETAAPWQIVFENGDFTSPRFGSTRTLKPGEAIVDLAVGHGPGLKQMKKKLKATQQLGS